MRDVECPYCEHEQDIDHDDGYGYEEDAVYEQECPACGKTFVYTTSVSYHYGVKRADCLNGGEHALEPVHHYPPHWPDWRRCADCGREDRGERFVSTEELGIA